VGSKTGLEFFVIVTERRKVMLNHNQIAQAIEDRENIIVSGGTGCFAKGRPILMFNGKIKPVEDVVVGDKVMGPDGEARVVKDTHHGIDEMVWIVPYMRDPFVVNIGHSLALVRKGGTNFHRVTVAEYLALPEDHQWHLAIFRPKSRTFRYMIIQEVKRIGKGEYFGFEVDHPDHLFVDGKYMVQGNSGKTTILTVCSDYVSSIAGLDQRDVVVGFSS